MNKIILSLSAAILLLACNSAEKPSSEDAATTEVENTDAPEVEEEVTDEPESAKAGFIGSWTVDAATAGAQMDVLFNEDGTYSQTVAGQASSGTWKKIDDTHLEMMNPNLKKPQTWEIKKMTDTQLDICWNSSSAKPLTIPFTRAN